MKSLWLRMCGWMLCVAIASAGIAGCSKDNPTAPKETERTNNVKPNANARIISQTVFGDVDKYSVVRHMQPADDGSLCFTGYQNTLLGVGVMNANGGVRWFQRMTYDPLLLLQEGHLIDYIEFVSVFVVKGSFAIRKFGKRI